MITITQVKEANAIWFSKGNKRFFGDLGYKVLHGEISKKPYLIQISNKWHGAFTGEAKKVFYLIKNLGDNLKIGDCIKEVESWDDVEKELKNL